MVAFRVLHAPASAATRVCCRNARIKQHRFAMDLGQKDDARMSSPGSWSSQTFDSPQVPPLSRPFTSGRITTTSTPTDKPMATTGQGSAGSREIMDITMSTITSKEKIRLKGVEQTLLPMVLFKIRDSQNPQPILGDPYAKQLLNRCDIDLDATHFSATVDDRYVTWIANRAKRFDQWCQDFLNAYQEPVTVLHLGCGLDCRYFRVERQPEFNVRWIDLDQLMVVDLRNRLIPGPVEGDYALRTLDVTKDGWFRDVPADRPTLIVAEGLMPYLEPEQGQKLIHDLVEYFGGSGEGEGHGGQLVFDTLGSLSVRLTGHIKALRSSKATFKWGVDEPEQIQGLHSRLRLQDRVLWREYTDRHPPFFGKYGTIAASMMPSFEKNIQFWRFSF